MTWVKSDIYETFELTPFLSLCVYPNQEGYTALMMGFEIEEIGDDFIDVNEAKLAAATYWLKYDLLIKQRMMEAVEGLV